jgi:hypothetical protein
MATVHKNPIKEAERYLNNAKQILSEKAEKDGNYYSDPNFHAQHLVRLWSSQLYLREVSCRQKHQNLYMRSYLS